MVGSSVCIHSYRLFGGVRSRCERDGSVFKVSSDGVFVISPRLFRGGCCQRGQFGFGAVIALAHPSATNGVPYGALIDLIDLDSTR